MKDSILVILVVTLAIFTAFYGGRFSMMPWKYAYKSLKNDYESLWKNYKALLKKRGDDR